MYLHNFMQCDVIKRKSNYKNMEASCAKLCKPGHASTMAEEHFLFLVRYIIIMIDVRH